MKYTEIIYLQCIMNISCSLSIYSYLINSLEIIQVNSDGYHSVTKITQIQCSLHTEKYVILNVSVTIILSNQLNVLK